MIVNCGQVQIGNETRIVALGDNGPDAPVCLELWSCGAWVASAKAGEFGDFDNPFLNALYSAMTEEWE